jgi:uncharacterized protein DUF6894
MAIYYFHLCDGTDILLDPDGRELDSTLVASAATAEARAIIAADAAAGHIDLTHRIEVHDASREVVFCVEFEDAVQVTHGPQRVRPSAEAPIPRPDIAE